MENGKEASSDDLGPQLTVQGHVGGTGAKRVCVVQASSVFYDTPATIGNLLHLLYQVCIVRTKWFPELSKHGFL